MASTIDSIAPGAETSLRAHLIEVETCCLEVRCATCRGTTVMPFRLLLRKYGPDHEVGAIVSRLMCKRCNLPPSSVQIKENMNDHRGTPPGWSVQLIDRPAVSASGRSHGQDAARHAG